MAAGAPFLVLTPFLQKERVLLLLPADAIRLCRDGGHAALPRNQALAYWATVSRLDHNQTRDFLSQSRLSSFPLTELDQVQLLGHLRDLLKNDELVIVRESENLADESTSSVLQQRRLVNAIERAARSSLAFEGRKHKLVAGDDLGRVPNRDQYEVVSRDAAIPVLDGLARQSDPSLVKLLVEARGLLTRDWRPPLRPDGLVLLKAMLRLEAAQPSRELGPRKAKPVEVEEAVEPDLDQACQASTLVNASREGVPFCQECH
jgi:hypothetical protein